MVYTRLNELKEAKTEYKTNREEYLKLGINPNRFFNLCFNENYFNDETEPLHTEEQIKEDYNTIPTEIKNEACQWWNFQADKQEFPLITNQDLQKDLVLEAVRRYTEFKGLNNS